MRTCNLRYLPSLGVIDPYAASIERLISQQFPQLASGRTEDVMEAVMMEFLGTKQVRVGPRPNPESQSLMRDVVRRSIAQGRCIPVYIPSAAVKVPVGESSIDIAELSMLKMLESLQNRVRQHYAPGLSMRMRMEDLTEYVLTGTEPYVKRAVDNYITTMQTLVNVLGFSDWLTLVPESTLANEAEWLSSAASIAAVIYQYLSGRLPFEQAAPATGLKWPITQEMRQYFIDRYKKLYPAHGMDDYMKSMAAYFSSTLTRRNMNASGYDPTFDGRLELYFGNRLPDAPLVSPRVYYRTVPLSQSSLHIPYWQAKGFFKINQQGEPRISLGPWEGNYMPGQLELSNGTETALIRADYIESD